LLQSGPVLGFTLKQVFRSVTSPALCAGAMYATIAISLKFNLFQITRVDHLAYAVVMGALVYGFLLACIDKKIFNYFVDFLKWRRV
jgi:type IV secretory pathway VirB3-like protein